MVAALAAVILCGCIYSYFGGFGTGKCYDTKEFANYAKNVSDITIPESVRIIALGEATHGNSEFQQLKLDVFKLMVEKYDVRAFALEAVYGNCEAVNRYIHGANGTAEEAAKAIGFTIYRTKEMADLIEWMRQYNQTAEPGNGLRFYGFDMQRYEYDYEFLLEAAKQHDLQTAELEQLWDKETGGLSASYSPDQKASVYEAVKQELLQLDDSTTAQAVHFADILLQNVALGRTINDYMKGNALRDSLMAMNTLWILEQEEVRGNERIFITAHNGHIERDRSYGSEGKVMGNIFSDQLGDGYFAIGTNFYKARVNLPKGSHGKRSNHTYYSHNPLAKASKKCGYETSWLDFSTIPDNSDFKQFVSGYTWLGNLGENYNPLSPVFPMAYRVWDSPAKSYDGMIFVAKAHPIEVLE